MLSLNDLERGGIRPEFQEWDLAGGTEVGEGGKGCRGVP